ncbi:hypothetical protein BGZ91_003938 [Linnemannia elongata]|nr:hypothetical protein BGZ91_003938 [Linnemannia elongata]KAG0081286.1 hypothetical protein BGZ90_009300 [Linnemannia elongata]
MTESIESSPKGVEPSVSTPSSDSADSNDSQHEVTITEAMLKEEEKLEEETQAKEKEKIAQLKAKAATEFTDTVNKQRFQRLNFLIEKSTLYANFLAKKLEKQQQDARDKAAAEEVKREAEKEKRAKEGVSEETNSAKPTAPTATRTSTRHSAAKQEPASTVASRKEKASAASAASKKRKADETEYSIADYLTKDTLKKQKQVETEADKKASAPAPAQRVISARQPKLVTGGVLRDYQLAGVEWMVSLYENGLNGILADEMGLGKTLQTISFLAYLRERGVWGPFLVVAPLSTLANWVMEFERFVPGIPVEMYHGTPEEREHKRNHKLKKLDTTFPVVVTSYEVIMRDRKYLSKYQWKYIIVDEGHRLKNMDCRLIRELKSYHSANRLLLTGTPLQNNLSELWSLLNFLLPDIFDDREGFEEWFDFSDINAKEGQDRILGEESQSGIVSSLHHILKPFLLRRVKTDVEKSLPKKKEYLLYAPLTPVQKEWYDATLSKDIRKFIIQKKSGWEDVGDSDDELEEAMQKTDAITLGEDGSDTRETSDATSEAVEGQAIIAKTRRSRGATARSYAEKSDRQYFKELENGPAETAVKELTAREIDIRRATKAVVNMNLKNVIMQLRKVCNHPFLFDWPLDPLTNLPVVSEDLLNSSGKMLVLNRLLEALFARGHKVLIFSQFTTMLDIIEEWAVTYKKWHVSRIDGMVKQDDRRRQIAEYNSNPARKLFLLSTRSGGLGINLTSADTVIIFDSDWNPQMDLQAQDRVHRIGQTKPVMIYRLVTANTVENRIIERANSKRKLEKLVIHKGKFKQAPSLTNAANDRKTNLADLAAMLAQDDGEKIQLVNKDDVVISDKHLEVLLDRSDAAYAANATVTSANAEAGVTTFAAVEEVKDDQNDVLKVDNMGKSSD